MRRRKRKEASTAEGKGISKSDRMKRLAACCGIAGFLLACLAALLNYRQHLQAWQVKVLHFYVRAGHEYIIALARQ